MISSKLFNYIVMTPREKAKELFRKFIPPTQQWDDIDGYITDEYHAKQCALIAVDEILEMDLPILEEEADKFYEYWQEVKQEIINL